MSFCVSMKAGYSQVRLFVHDIAGVDAPDLLAEEHRMRQAWRPRLGNGRTGVADLAGFEPAWRQVYARANLSGNRFVHVHVVRDPLERLLSGYQDKCVRKRRTVQFRHCPCRERGTNFSSCVATLAARHGADPHYLLQQVDTHFRPQAVGCGSWPAFDETLVWDGGSSGHEQRGLHSAVQRLCKTHGLPLDACRRHFPEHSAASHRTDAAESILRGRAYSKPLTLAAALHLYKADYEKLRVPYPKWTQALLEMEPSAAPSGPSPHAPSQSPPSWSMPAPPPPASAGATTEALSCRTWLKKYLEPPSSTAYPRVRREYDAMVNSSDERSSSGGRGGQAAPRVWALITFGFELSMLMLHMRVLQEVVAGFLVLEATTTLHAVNAGLLSQYDAKPIVLTDALRRGTFPSDLAAKTTVTVLNATAEAARCHASGGQMGGRYGCWETRHRHALLEALFNVAAPQDVALFADVDEIARPHVVSMLARCFAFPPRPTRGTSMVVLLALEYKYGVHCVARQATWANGPHAWSVRSLLQQRRSMGLKFFGSNRFVVRDRPKVRDGGWHLTSFGEPEELRQKLATWSHAELFDEGAHPASLDVGRLERCAASCYVANARAWSKNGTPAPACEAGDLVLPGTRRLITAESWRADLPTYLKRHRAEFPAYFRYLRRQ